MDVLTVTALFEFVEDLHSPAKCLICEVVSQMIQVKSSLEATWCPTVVNRKHCLNELEWQMKSPKR